MQVFFKKFVKDQTPSEEEKKEEFSIQVVKDLIQSGYMTKDGESEKKLRADDIFSALVAKMIDMDLNQID